MCVCACACVRVCVCVFHTFNLSEWFHWTVEELASLLFCWSSKLLRVCAGQATATEKDWIFHTLPHPILLSTNKSATWSVGVCRIGHCPLSCSMFIFCTSMGSSSGSAY